MYVCLASLRIDGKWQITVLETKNKIRNFKFTGERFKTI